MLSSHIGTAIAIPSCADRGGHGGHSRRRTGDFENVVDKSAGPCGHATVVTENDTALRAA